MKAKKWLEGLVEKYEDDPEFRLEETIIDFTEKVVAKMAEKNIKRNELARRLGVSKAFITKLLNGNPNLTIKSMMSISDALGCDLNLDLYPKGFTVRRFYVHDNNKINAKDFTKPVKPAVEGAVDASAA